MFQPIDDTGTQRAIRFGINNVLQNSNTNKTSDFSNESLQMVSQAQEHMGQFIKSNGSSSSVSTLITDNMNLIKLTVTGVVLAYEAISNQLDTLTEKRKNFEEELQLNMATFTIPGNIESKDLSVEEKAVTGFFEKMEKFPLLFDYSGVKRIHHEEDPRTKRYCALPLYMMNQLKHPIASPLRLDEARIAINLLFNSKAIQVMQKIANDFRTDNTVIAFFESTIRRANYLNKLRAPRLILTALFNILWNIQHPIDCGTGYNLTLKESIRLCGEFKKFLNLYLSDKALSGPYEITSKQNELQNMLFHIELNANNLHIGFIDELLRRFNLKDLTNSAHRTLRELDTSLFQLIFHKKNPVTGVKYPDKLAAPDIAYTINVLNELLNRNPTFLAKFNEESKLIPETYLAQTHLNPQVKTIIDVLIVFCHLTNKQRNQLIDSLKEYPNAGKDDRIFMAKELRKFNRHYILPIEKITTQLIEKTFDKFYLLKISKLTALRLIPLFTLVAADYRIDVDIKETLNKNEPANEPNNLPLYRSGKEQVEMINDTAQVHTLEPPNVSHGEYYYHWSISPYLALTEQAAQSIDALPSKQYRMTQITELLDCISELTQNYKSFLQFKTFQTFLLDCLQRVNKEYRQFAEEALSVEEYLSREGQLDRTLKDVLLTMVGKLSDNLSTVRETIDDITHIVDSPDFTELRKHELAKQVKRIEEKFVLLFGKIPIDFKNAYSLILSQTDLGTICFEKNEKTKKLYEFVKQFFYDAKNKLEENKPELPKAPHFLNQLKKDKLEKYLDLMDKSIKHIDDLISDQNYSLDARELFRQLKLISSDDQTRSKENISKSTYCLVILNELKQQFTHQRIKIQKNHNASLIDESILTQTDDTNKGVSALLSTLAPTKRDIIPVFSSNSISAEEASEERLVDSKMSKTLDILKLELLKILEEYIATKQQQRPTHWFYLTLQIFKDFFAQYLNFVKARLLETKIQVAQKVLEALKSAPEEGLIRRKPSLTLFPSEMTTLSNGVLGHKTLFFREHPFWKQMTG